MRFDLREFSGSLGDLGTFIPLTVAMITVSGLDAGTVLVFAGLFNILSGVAFRQPIPVQPMKAIAAVAIAEGLAPGEIAASGFAAGLVILILGLSGLVSWAERVVPRPVVRGIQLGVGVKLAWKGVAMVAPLAWTALDGRITAIIAGAIVLIASRTQRFPTALVIFTAGLVLLFIEAPSVLTGVSYGWSGPSLVLPDLAAWKTGFLMGTLPQLPLTLLNSVIAVCALSEDLYPGRGIKTKPMAVSVGLMNVGACLFGAMPACHGSGGLAGQHRFGARTGGSVVMLGGVKVILGVAAGTAALTVLAAYPAAILGVLLIFAGVELAKPARECKERSAFFIALATAAGIILVDTLVGFLAGLLAAGLVAAASKVRS